MKLLFIVDVIKNLTTEQWLIFAALFFYFVIVVLLFFIHRRNTLIRMNRLKEDLIAHIDNTNAFKDERLQGFKDGLQKYLSDLSERINKTDDKINAISNLLYEFANNPEDTPLNMADLDKNLNDSIEDNQITEPVAENPDEGQEEIELNEKKD